MTTITNSIISHIGYTAEAYEKMKFECYLEWVLSHNSTWRKKQAAVTYKGLQNNFAAKWQNIEARYIAHLSMFTNEQTIQGKRALWMDYMSGFNHNYPKALNPVIKLSEEEELCICPN